MNPKKICEGIYECGETEIYRVDIINRTCTCPSFFYGNKNCKNLKECDKANEINTTKKIL